MSPYQLDDTIVAISSPPGPGARLIVRLSGPQGPRAIATVCRLEDQNLLRIDRPRLLPGTLNLTALGGRLPCLVFMWPPGRSYTGEWVAEIHTIGSMVIGECILEDLCRAGCRLAEPGEFTLRAFLTGRVDLTEAEAVLAAVQANNDQQFDIALRQLSGGLAQPILQIREALFELIVEVEAGLDFPDEDLPFISREELASRICKLRVQTEELLGRMRWGFRSASDVRAVLFGTPNVGKSSLFNRLLNREEALVFDRPGTTRDYLVARFAHRGVECLLIDTAGLDPHVFNPQPTQGPDEGNRLGGEPSHGPQHGVSPFLRENKTLDQIATTPIALPAESQASSAQALSSVALPADHQRHLDRLAQYRGWEQVTSADIRIFCLDATRPISPWEREEISREAGHRVLVFTKVDLRRPREVPPGSVLVSSVTGEGIEELKLRLCEEVLAIQGRGGDVVAITAFRCFESVRTAHECLQKACSLVENAEGEELVAEELRQALLELGKVSGAIYTEDILNGIFRRFCIGK